MNWQQITISPDNTHFLYEGKPIFDKHFIEVLKFHALGLAPVKDETGAYHIGSNGNPLYSERYTRTFGYYCNRAAVISGKNWFHINEKGERIYSKNYLYAGDFKDGIAGVKLQNEVFKHIDKSVKFINNKEFLDLGVFHKNYATAKDKDGWFHIDKVGNAIYLERYLTIEPFYNGFALVAQFDNNKVIINEHGEVAHKI
jgi:hypothetical protein